MSLIPAHPNFKEIMILKLILLQFPSGLVPNVSISMPGSLIMGRSSQTKQPVEFCWFDQSDILHMPYVSYISDNHVWNLTLVELNLYYETSK